MQTEVGVINVLTIAWNVQMETRAQLVLHTSDSQMTEAVLVHVRMMASSLTRMEIAETVMTHVLLAVNQLLLAQNVLMGTILKMTTVKPVFPSKLDLATVEEVAMNVMMKDLVNLVTMASGFGRTELILLSA
jgi:hypothetical protein